VSAAAVAETETVTISYDTGGTVGAKNWVGIFRHGVKPGTGSPSLDWRYASAVSGSWTWGPGARGGWTNEASSIAPGEVDVYLFANDGYSVLAGPTVLDIRAASTPRTDPKPAVDGVSELNVLTFNLWIGGSKVANGAHQVAEVMRQADVDVAFLPERGDAPANIAAELGYDQFTPASTNTGIVSRYPILATSTVGRWTKAILDVNGTEVAVYGGHLEYRWYSEYLPRGYGAGAVGDWPAAYKSWDELDAPVTDVDVILEMNAQSAKIGAGPAPLRVPEGWLLLHHGVSGAMPKGFELAHGSIYAAGAMLFDPADPRRVIARTMEPLLTPETPEEISGTLANVVFPTAIEEIAGRRFVFYGMADSSIGVAELVPQQ